MHELQPKYTTIEKQLQVTHGDVVLESTAGFPRGESNLYCVSANGNVVWAAEKPEPNVLFLRIALNKEGRTLSTYTTGGHACELDLRTGKLVSLVRIQ